MSATVISDPTMVVSNLSLESQPAPPTNLIMPQTEPEFVKCHCCSLTEECTPSYIQTVRERFLGKWICGLCAEAVKYEVIRTEGLITTEEAMTRHMNMCTKFNASSPPANPTVHLISAMRQVLRRSLDSPRMVRSTPGSPANDEEREIRCSGLARSGSCFATLTGS